MIVEDNKDVASYLDYAVRSLGYETVMAYDGTAAFDLLRHMIPDMILLDMYLPDVNGDEILCHVRAKDRLQQIPVVVLTGEVRTLNQEVKMLANFTLIKPIDFEILSQLITRIAHSPLHPLLENSPTRIVSNHRTSSNYP